MAQKTTTVRVTDTTYDKLVQYAMWRETLDDTILRLLEAHARNLKQDSIAMKNAIENKAKQESHKTK